MRRLKDTMYFEEIIQPETYDLKEYISKFKVMRK